jgi:uncharacterized membrane protein YecN with MAPEG domain
MTAFAPAVALIAAYALMLSVLSLLVSLRRQSVRTSYGDAGDEVLRHRIRAHGNFIEYAPMAALVVLALGLVETAPVLVWLVAAIFLATRVLHAAAMLTAKSPSPRALAMVVQHLTFLAASLLLAGKLAGLF